MDTMKNQLYKLGRKKQIELSITNIGNIEEKNDCFCCYADQRMLKKKSLEKYKYALELRSTITKNEELESIAKYYNINKPVYYIFKNIHFDKPIEIYANLNTYLIFSNCTFKDTITIGYADQITLENNKYYSNYSSKPFLNNQGMLKQLRIIDDNFINSKIDHHPTNFGIDLNVENLEIINSNIHIDNSVKYNNETIVKNHSGLNIKANKTLILKSTIEVAEFYLDSKKITISSDSIINASSGMIIENENKDYNLSIINSSINTPYFIYNKEEVSEANDEETKLKNNRKKLTNTLKQIYDSGNTINQEQIIKATNIINNKPLKKVLKRKEQFSKTNQN